MPPLEPDTLGLTPTLAPTPEQIDAAHLFPTLPKRTREGRSRATNVIEFIECLIVPSGKNAGKKIKLDAFQKRFLRDIYEPHWSNGNRAVRRAILSMARKNGKTVLIAAIVLAHLIGPEAIRNGEIYSAANDRDQAAIVFKYCKQLLEADLKLLAKVEILNNSKTIVGLATSSFYRAVSAEAGTKYGFNPTVVSYDELAQARDRELYDTLDTSFGGREEPLFVVLSTQSNDPQHILSKLIDDGLSAQDPTIVCHLHAADEGCELADQVQWAKANPALATFRNRDDLALAVAKAIRMPMEEAKVRNLLLNQRVSPVATLISRADWEACKGAVTFKDGERVYLALDLSKVIDLTALAMVSESDPASVRVYFWKPADYLSEHSYRDFSSGHRNYINWRDQGHLMTSPGRSVDYQNVANFIGALSKRYKVIAMAYDRWRISDLLKEFDRIGFRAYEDSKAEDAYGDYGVGLRLMKWGQGYQDMSPAVEALVKAIADRNLIHPDNPCLNWNVANGVARMDESGNTKLDKKESTFRIDGLVALAMAMGLRSRDRAPANAVDIEAMIA